MRKIRWGGVLTASLLSMTMLCTVIPEVSYAAVPAEKDGYQVLDFIPAETKSSQLEIGDIDKFEIVQPARDTWYEGTVTELRAYYVPMRGLKYRITCKDGTVIENTLENCWDGETVFVHGLCLTGEFKYCKEDEDQSHLVDMDRDDNAIIYNLGTFENQKAIQTEVPITFHAASPVESITLDQNPWEDQTFFQDNAESALENREGLAFTVTYKDGTTKTVNVDEDDSGTFIDDGYNENVKYTWKNYDDEGYVQTGDNAIVISYIGAAVEIPVTVVGNPISSIQIVKNPSKISYEVTDYDPDLYGMQLEITFDDGETKTVTVDEHGSSPQILDGIINSRIESWIIIDEGRKCVVVEYSGCTIYYYPTFQYAAAFSTATAILPGQTVSVSLNANTKYRMFRFVPLDTEEFEISSAGTVDTYVELLDANGNILEVCDDDDDDNSNFRLKYRLEAGKTYYYLVRLYTVGNTGTFSCTLKGSSSYTITYNLNGGTNNASNPTAYYSENVVLKNPTRPQYTFEGWYTDSACKNKITQIAGSSKRNYVLYAKWQEVNPGKAKLSSASNSKSKKIAVKYKKIKDVDGYEIAYATNKKFKKASSITSNKTKATIGKLKKGKTYYVRVCGYKLDSTGQMVRGKWSPVKKVTVKK